MVRTVFLVLALLPMLFPRGVCVCRFLPDLTTFVSISDDALEDSRKSSCCNHSDEGGEESPCDGSQESPVDRPAGCPADHEPVCLSLAETQLQLPSVDRIDLTLDLAATAIVTAVPDPVLPCETGRPIDFRPKKTSLFISCCALLL